MQRATCCHVHGSLAHGLLLEHRLNKQVVIDRHARVPTDYDCTGCRECAELVAGAASSSPSTCTAPMAVSRHLNRGHMRLTQHIPMASPFTVRMRCCHFCPQKPSSERPNRRKRKSTYCPRVSNHRRKALIRSTPAAQSLGRQQRTQCAAESGRAASATPDFIGPRLRAPFQVVCVRPPSAGIT